MVKIFLKIGLLLLISIDLCGQKQSICFKGKISRCLDQMNSPSNSIKVGDLATGYLSYDLTKANILSDSTYQFKKSFYNKFLVTVKGQEFKSDSLRPELEILKDDNTIVDVGTEKEIQDNFSIYSLVNVFPKINNVTWVSPTISWYASDNTHLLFHNKKLPFESSISEFNSIVSVSSNVFEVRSFAFDIVVDQIVLDCDPNSITQTEKVLLDLHFLISPNPSNTGLFQIQGNFDVTKIQVYNAQGNSITPTIVNQITLDLSAFPKGMYIAVATVDGVRVVKKIVIE